MITIQKYSEKDKIAENQKKEIVKFLFEHLEQYGDPQGDIAAAVNYSLGYQNKPGGTIVTATHQNNQSLVGAVVLNKTGMGGYIPENILVYIATDKKLRGQGIGKLLMRNAIDSCEGDIALHCKPENPAMQLYKKLGFTTKYLEMRLKK
ncbi:GNAT family acetyltransferase [Chryseobacterium formosense]|uniref:GNAT family acetyltransferase n=1 Tax=Chryseobacterium formosense TaxID=236814 RepID=A0A085ZAD2_9FLAO|nr:GNAT family N-acetyltransferase [Chryseobacterium formosense]KFF01396.1 GNAT family acetyltransferase [Chryseobacterium formosense]SFT46739.1 Acetyltransferase (GNAT) family protein [Chryseobacterium formosense]